MTFSIEHNGNFYAIDVLSAIDVTRVTEAGIGYDADASDLPEDFRDQIADHLVATWAAEHPTQLQPGERSLARHIVQALLPCLDDDERDVEDVLRGLWTRPGRAA